MPLQRKPQFCLYSYIYFEQPLDISRLDSTNGPTRAPPFVPHTGGARSNAASEQRSRVEISSPTYREAPAPFFPSPQPLFETTPWHKAGRRNSSTLPALARILGKHHVCRVPEILPTAKVGTLGNLGVSGSGGFSIPGCAFPLASKLAPNKLGTDNNDAICAYIS